MNDERRSHAARQGREARRERERARQAEWQDRGRHEANIPGQLELLARLGVTVAEPSGRPRMRRNMLDEPSLEVGELSVSLEAITFTPREGLHPASMAHALLLVMQVCGRLPIGRWEGWHKGYDEHLAECYSTTLVRVIEDDTDGLLDVDPVAAVLG